jgi:hypothetical protein
MKDFKDLLRKSEVIMISLRTYALRESKETQKN